MLIDFIECPQTGFYTNAIHRNRVHSVIEKALEIGDTVWYDERKGMYPECPWSGQTLIHIHFDPENDKRKWGVVAFKGDIPKSVYFSDLRRTR